MTNLDTAGDVDPDEDWVSARTTHRKIVVLGIIAAFVCGIGAVVAVAASGDSEPGSYYTPQTSATPWSPSPKPATPESVLVRQAGGLLGGHQATWMAPFDPSKTAAVKAAEDMYANLRGLGVTWWHPQLTGSATSGTIRVTFSYCLLRTDCGDPGTDIRNRPRPERAVYDVTFTEQLTIVAFEPVYEKAYVARSRAPWQTGRLAIARGDRVIVAGPTSLTKQVRATLKTAETAARNADQWAVWDNLPPRYLIFLAPKKEWKTWYAKAWDDTTQVAGYALTLNDTAEMVAVIKWPSHDLTKVMRHELGHIATLYAANPQLSYRGDWLVEGIAEVIAYGGRDGRVSPRLDEVRRHIRAGKWTNGVTGEIKPIGKGGDAQLAALNALYGMRHLAVGCMIEKYGKAGLLKFFDEVVRQGKSEIDARGLHVSWITANNACVTWIKTVAR